MSLVLKLQIHFQKIPSNGDNIFRNEKLSFAAINLRLYVILARAIISTYLCIGWPVVS